MLGGSLAERRHRKLIIRCKTGCGTCRVRKIKCDEGKPLCQRCVSTGRTCDGYRAVFKSVPHKSDKESQSRNTKPQDRLQLYRTITCRIMPQEIKLLERHFSVKTIFNVNMDCSEEARQVLYASLSNPPIRRAISCLKALREDFEGRESNATAVVHPRQPEYYDGLHNYSLALRGLASKLSHLDSDGLKSVLLCCQVFISIEQLRDDYAAMTQHIIRGLIIMHEWGARPRLVSEEKLVPAHRGSLPFLDVFIIKFFAVPCKFAELRQAEDMSKIDLCSSHSTTSGNFRYIAPDLQAELTKIADSTLKCLRRVSNVRSVNEAVEMLSERNVLLDSLETWSFDLEVFSAEAESDGPEPISVSFMRLFQLILRIVLLGTLESSPCLNAKLQTEHDRLQRMADGLGTRVKAYRIHNRVS